MGPAANRRQLLSAGHGTAVLREHGIAGCWAQRHSGEPCHSGLPPRPAPWWQVWRPRRSSPAAWHSGALGPTVLRRGALTSKERLGRHVGHPAAVGWVGGVERLVRESTREGGIGWVGVGSARVLRGRCGGQTGTAHSRRAPRFTSSAPGRSRTAHEARCEARVRPQPDRRGARQADVRRSAAAKQLPRKFTGVARTPGGHHQHGTTSRPHPVDRIPHTARTFRTPGR